jgi:hypothetical protein
MAIVKLYSTLSERVQELAPQERVTRVRTLVWLMCGMVYSRSVHLSAIAQRIPGVQKKLAKKLSKVQRLARWLDNEQVDVRVWYEPLARSLLTTAWRSRGQVRLVIDATRVSQQHQLLMVALTYRRRTLPIAWTWVRCRKGHSSGQAQEALFIYIRQLLPLQAAVLVLGDSEFTPLQKAFTVWGWSYALRQKGSHRVRCSTHEPWLACEQLVTAPGQQRWLTDVHLTQAHQHRTNLLALWPMGETDPWLIATNLPTAAATQRHYSRRMWIEEMFGDFKGHGFDLERTCLRHEQRLSRLTFAVALLYVWLVAFGAKAIKAGHRHLVDRRDRRDLSIFRIGLDLLHWRLDNELACVLPPVPYMDTAPFKTVG